MRDENLKEYAQFLIENHATDIEWLTIHEMAEDYFGGDIEELDYVDAEKVATYLSEAVITVTFPKEDA